MPKKYPKHIQKYSDVFDDIFAIRAAKAESVASQLPGRTNGPADAYRHIIWAAELTRRAEPFSTEAALTVKEYINEERDPEQKETKQDLKDAAEMDIHNNEIGFAVGKMIKEQGGGFKDVIAAAQSVMEQGWGKPTGATIVLPDGTRVAIPKTMLESKWRNNPTVTSDVMIDGKKVARKRVLSNAQSNKPVGNWRDKFVAEPYSYSYGKPKMPDDPIGGSDASADAGSGDVAGKSVDIATATAKATSNSSQPAKEPSPEAKKMLAGLRNAKDTPSEILNKPVSQVTEDEVEEVIGSPPYWGSSLPLHNESQGLVRGVMEHVWGTGPVMKDATGRPMDNVLINPYPKSPTPARAVDGGSVTDGAYRIGRALADQGSDTGLIEPVRDLQTQLNIFPGVSGYTAAKPLKIDGDFGPKTNDRLREVVRTNGTRPVLAAISERPEREFLL